MSAPTTRHRVLSALLVGLLAVVSLLVAGCSGPDDPETQRSDAAAIEDLLADADAARTGVVRTVVSDLELEFDGAFLGGTRLFRICGESWAPHGVQVRDHVTFYPSPLGVDPAIEVVAAVLEDEGWEVERPPNPMLVIGRRDGIEVRAVIGSAAVQFDINNVECLEVSDDASRDFADRSHQDLTWERPGSPS